MRLHGKQARHDARVRRNDDGSCADAEPLWVLATPLGEGEDRGEEPEGFELGMEVSCGEFEMRGNGTYEHGSAALELRE